MCPYCNCTQCNLLETKNFISMYSVEDKVGLDTTKMIIEEELSSEVKKEKAKVQILDSE